MTRRDITTTAAGSSPKSSWSIGGEKLTKGVLGSATKWAPGSWSSVICSRLGGRPSRCSTSSKVEAAGGAVEEVEGEVDGPVKETVAVLRERRQAEFKDWHIEECTGKLSVEEEEEEEEEEAQESLT
ncbi:hypothetical protein CRUP_005547 [Coryphaenoides rupestris]|nr:hypothetical protein CRUP_005547 [Coryphaenoides rupestris]